MVATAPVLAGAIDAVIPFDDAKLLSVTPEQLRCWHLPRLLAIGAAARAMSPVGGGGIRPDAYLTAIRLLSVEFLPTGGI